MSFPSIFDRVLRISFFHENCVDQSRFVCTRHDIFKPVFAREKYGRCVKPCQFCKRQQPLQSSKILGPGICPAPLSLYPTQYSGHMTGWWTQSSRQYKLTYPSREPFSYLPRTGVYCGPTLTFLFPVFVPQQCMRGWSAQSFFPQCVGPRFLVQCVDHFFLSECQQDPFIPPSEARDISLLDIFLIRIQPLCCGFTSYFDL